MIYLRIFGAICTLAAVFLFGMWLTWPDFPYNPSGFPIDRRFVAVSLNDVGFNYERMLHLPTFEVRRSEFQRLRSSGYGVCNAWSGEIVLTADQTIVWKDVQFTTAGCGAAGREDWYLKTLLKTTRWRTEGGTLILENDSDHLRFKLAPRSCSWPWCAARFQLADR
jgi:heat shock protein HslJ